AITAVILTGIAIFIGLAGVLTDYTLTSVQALEKQNDKIREDLNATAIINTNTVEVSSNWVKSSIIIGIIVKDTNTNNIVCNAAINQEINPLDTITITTCSNINSNYRVILLTQLGNAIVADNKL
ncbi:MAG: hypothetical protein D6752_04205, partial [Candidatus Nitrosothermus koennekii]